MKAVAIGVVLAGAAAPALAQAVPEQPPPATSPAEHGQHTAHEAPAPASPSAQPPANPHAGHPMPETEPAPTPEAAPALAHEHMPGMAHPVPEAAPPEPPTDRAADRYFDPERMARARHHMQTEHGGMKTGTVMVNIAEYQFRDDGEDGYRWDGEAWFGGDLNRLVVKTEGEGATDGEVDDAEVQVLWARAISPFFNLEAGARYDFEPDSRGYAVLGAEGVASYWFDVEAAVFLSEDGDLLGRFKASQDFRIAQKLIFQPRLEVNLAAQAVPEADLGAGLSDAEIGVRLRYEIRREFAPYVGVSWESRVGDTADLARDAGEDVSASSIVVGLRTWF